MAKYIMEGQVYGGRGGFDKVETCVQFDTEDISWLKDKKLYGYRERKIYRVLNKKIKGKSMVRYMFKKIREAAPEDVVELSINKPVLRPMTHAIMIPVFASEEERKKANGKSIKGDVMIRACIEFDSEETLDRHREDNFKTALPLVKEALENKRGRPIEIRSSGSIVYHQQALEEDEVDLKITKD